MEQRLGTTNELIEALERNGTTGTIALTDEAGEMRAVIITPKTWVNIQQAFAKRRVPKQRAPIKAKRKGGFRALGEPVTDRDFLGHPMTAEQKSAYHQHLIRSRRVSGVMPRHQGKQSYRSRHARKRLTRARSSG